MDPQTVNASNEEWYFNDWFIAIMILIFLPLGIYLAVKAPQKFSIGKLLGVVGVVVLIALAPTIGRLFKHPVSGIYATQPKANVWFEVFKEGKICLHVKAGVFPAVYRCGTYTVDKNSTKIDCAFDDGDGPYQLIMNDDGFYYSDAPDNKFVRTGEAYSHN